VSSINTGNGIKNRHAKSKKWFDADKFPNIHFVSSKFIKTDKGYSVMGNLSIYGITKEFIMPFTFMNNTFTSTYMINRLDFKIGTKEGMSAKVPAELLVEISVPVSKL
jgi:polyisoprenoid-binding protein YceI